MRRDKKTVFTLNVDGYAPEITALTYPLIEAYAEKIGADFHIIGERKFPEWPVTYEKLQIYQLAQEMGNDWNIYIDSDALVHPDTPDLTALLPRDTVAHFGKDVAPVRWKSDRYFQRDGRHFGTGNWLTVASDLCLDLWRPLDDLTPAEAIANIFPTVFETISGVVNRAHLIDDYALSRNIARFGLKATTFREIFSNLGYKEVRNAAGQITQNDGGYFFYHHYLFPTDQKLVEMKKVLRNWKVVEIMGYNFPETPVDKAEKIQGWMSRPELEWLYEKSKGMQSVVGIGNFLGRSTFVLASGCNGDSGKVYAVDPFVFSGDWAKFVNPNLGLKAGEDFMPAFLKNCGHFKHLTVIKKTSLEAAALDTIPPEVDMVFLDGDHSYEAVMTDLKAWAPRTKKMICGHDFNDPMYPGVKQAVYEYFGADAIKVGPDSLWSAEAEDKT
jgi:hypothetical protein